MRRNQGHKGFTLVEVVVSLTIVTLIMAATLTAMRTLGDTQQRLEAVTERLDRMRLVSGFLQSTLRQAVPITPDPDAAGSTTAMLGREDELVWTAPLQGPPGTAGLHHMRLYRDGDGALGIQFLPRRKEAEPLDWSTPETQILAKNAEVLEIAYRAGPDGDWLPSWSGESDNMPQAVRLRIRVGERYWPDLVIAPDQYGMNDG